MASRYWRCQRRYDLTEKGPKFTEDGEKTCGLWMTDDPEIIAKGWAGQPFICKQCKQPKLPCDCREGYYTNCLGLKGCPHLEELMKEEN